MEARESKFANFIEDWLVNNLGVDENSTQLLKMVILVLVTIIVAIIIWRIGQFLINRFFKSVVRRTSIEWDNVLMEKKAFRKLGHLIPAIFITGVLPIVFSDYPGWIPIIDTLTTAYIALVVIRVIVAFIEATNVHLSRSERYRDKPIASFTQLGKMVVWIVGIIYVISILIDRNPLALFGAMGAISAVLLLIFKDSILGFIASIQLTINDMVRIGDWVSLPKYGADGDVIGIYLTTVKVSNWDKTISTVPTYSFVSDSFKNWRGMTESGGRRIKRALNIKISSIEFCDEEMLDRYAKIQLVQEYVSERRAEVAAFNKERNIDTEGSLINGRRMTNIGVFRIYILNYITLNPHINQDMTHIVRQLAPTEIGIPLEIYCFSALQGWVDYERVQSDLFDHIMAAARHFDLEIFESPASSDLRRLAEVKAAN